MLNAYTLVDRRLVAMDIEHGASLKEAVWVDLIAPSVEARARVEKECGQTIVIPSELGDIEASARFFENSEGLHIRSFFFYEDKHCHAGNATVAFTIKEGRLYTIREREFSAFRLYRMRAYTQTLLNGSAYELLLDLLETKIEQLADAVEAIYTDLETLSRIILEGKKTQEFDENLAKLASLEDTSSKAQICLMDTQRALNFLMRKERIPSSQLEQAREMLRDIESILPHNESLFQRISFLLQAAMGLIDLEQNRIMNILSLCSVMSILPTLIAAVYGMNFNYMPELDYPYAYPVILCVMVVSAVVPGLLFRLFRRKRWF